MKNEKLEAAREYLKKVGYDIPDDIILRLISTIRNKSGAVYEKGDFVNFYEGMGECWFGTVVSHSGQLYKVKTWATGDMKEYTVTVTDGDMRGLSTEEKAMEYWKVRSKTP